MTILSLFISLYANMNISRVDNDGFLGQRKKANGSYYVSVILLFYFLKDFDNFMIKHNIYFNGP